MVLRIACLYVSEIMLKYIKLFQILLALILLLLLLKIIIVVVVIM